MIISLLLFGCSSGESITDTVSTEASQVVTQTSTDLESTAMQDTTQESSIASAERSTVRAGQGANHSKKHHNKTDNKTTCESSTKHKHKQSTSHHKSTQHHTNTTCRQTTSKVTTSKTTTKATTTEPTEINCSVEIECKVILNNKDRLKEGHEDYVPSDGMIMYKTYVTVKNNSTVYDALKQACSQNGVYINSTTSSMGRYIVGFNNIDEKDCGKASGWKYKVNGRYPSVSCDNYNLKNGDCIVFTYVCQ